MLDLRYINLDHRADRRRMIESQLRLHRVSATRVSAKRPPERSETLPPSRVLPSERSLLATWSAILSDVVENGARDGAPWLIILEDDAVLVPLFRRRVIAALERAPREAMVVQLGALGPNTVSRHVALHRNLIRAVRVVLGRRWRTEVVREGGGDDPTFSTDLAFGTHATAVRVDTIPQLLQLLEPWEQPADVLFISRARQHPGRFLRHRRQLAFQAPFSSDIKHERDERDKRDERDGHASDRGGTDRR